MLSELRVAFALVDKDGDGRITPRELLGVMTSLGFKSDDVVIKQMIGCFDVDGEKFYKDTYLCACYPMHLLHFIYYC